MHKSFGARLRQHREEQAIALVTVSEQTKIQVALLEALERDDVSHWPSGIFRRAFIRAYAHAIGLDPDPVVREFVELYPEPADIAAAAALAAAAEAARTNGGSSNRFRDLVGSAIGSLARRRRGGAVDDRPPVTSARVEIPAAAEPIQEVEIHPSPDRVTFGEANAAAPAAPEPARAETAERDSMADPGPVETVNALASSSLPPPLDETNAAADQIPANSPAAREPDLVAVAHLCTRFGQAANPADIPPLLQEVASILGAIGLIVWVWDPLAEELWPALVHGYSDKVLAQIPPVRRDANNATAAAFRSAQVRAIGGGDRTSGALVVPLLTPAGCSGVLAIELHRENEPTTSVRAVATIFAAVLAQLIGDRVSEVPPQVEMMDSPIDRRADSSWR